jgi:thioredoxin 1
MKIFQTVKSLALVFTLTVATNASAGEWQAFNQESFDSAKSKGKTVILDFHATWCSTCKKQKPILESLVKEPDFDSVVAFTVDHDNATELKKSLKVQKQSTLIVFKGATEVGRQMGLTNKDEIKALFLMGI